MNGPAWVRELAMALPVYPQIVLVGNVRDEYYLPGPDPAAPPAIYRLEGVLERVLTERGYAAMAVHDIVADSADTTLLHRGATAPKEFLEYNDRMRPQPLEPGLDFNRLRGFLTALNANIDAEPVGFVVPFAGRMTAPGEMQTESARLFFAQAEAIAHQARRPICDGRHLPFNTVLWVVERQEDLPASFAAGNPRVRTITIALPDGATRELAADRAVRIVAAGGAEPASADALERARAKLAALSHGMQAREVTDIGQIAADQGIGLEAVEDAARLYRVGITENRWRDPTVLARVRDGESYLNARVLGQRDAVRKTMEIFMRSATGLTGAHASSTPNRPRGVLFLAGPTGVGKTELAKGIAELILGTDAAPVRFDMSEFASEHARDRLIGAPPGYVGHSAGGELTNAVRANPISVLLFDEIEKADSRIFDLFLQILEDGRLTDGRGATVYFTECVLVFTSNLGMAEGTGEGAHRSLTPEASPETVRTALRAAFDGFFSRRIQRPELLNRFGNGFVAMDFITPPVAERIMDLMVANVVGRVRAEHGVGLKLSAGARERLLRQVTRDLGNGGRGVGTEVERCLTDPLARELFLRPPEPGETVVAEEPTTDESGAELRFRR